MAYEILRIFYALWMGGILLLSLNALSTILFGKIRKKDMKLLFTLPLFLAVWPLAAFSPNGRKVLLVRFNKL